MNSENERTTRYRNDARSTEALLATALSKDPDRDESAYWDPVAALQHRLPRILDGMESLGRECSEKKRATAATILGQSMVETKTVSDRCCEILLRMLACEQSISVLGSIIFALGHLRDSLAVPRLIELQNHTESRIRYAVVSSLCGFEDEHAVAALIERSTDEDPDVRNWATFGLGSQIDTDTPAIREALLARLTEEDDEIRREAFVGLARRGDMRVIPVLLEELDRLKPEILRDWILVTDAADEVVKHALASGSNAWLPLLQKLVALKIGEPAETRAAIDRCTLSKQ